MRSRRAAFHALSTEITTADEALLRRLKEATGAKSLSAVVEAAVAALLRSRDLHVGLTVPSALGQDFVKRNYRVSPETVEMLDRAARGHRYGIKDMVRAALHHLAASEGHGPVQIGR